MKKWIKRIGIVFLSTIVLLYIAFLLMDEPVPTGKKGEEADLLAEKMLRSINKEAWDSTKWVQWGFKGARNFIWDRERQYLSVTWDENHAVLDLNNLDGGIVYLNGIEVSNETSKSLKQKAWAYFCNDSFWLNAPSKVFDEGTERSIVDIDGREALLITYASGGVTPGDSYLWLLDDSGRPESYKMWVSIIPVGGVKATWEDWKVTETRAVIATTHRLGPLTLPINDLKSGDNFKDLDISKDPFAVLN